MLPTDGRLLLLHSTGDLFIPKLYGTAPPIFLWKFLVAYIGDIIIYRCSSDNRVQFHHDKALTVFERSGLYEFPIPYL